MTTSLACPECGARLEGWVGLVVDEVIRYMACGHVWPPGVEPRRLRLVVDEGGTP